jgi:hypothetical protein
MGLETLRNGGQRGIHFTQTPLNYKSKDLEYSSLTKKAVMSQRSAQSTINKLAKDLEAPRNGRYDLQDGNPFHPDTTGLQI